MSYDTLSREELIALLGDLLERTSSEQREAQGNLDQQERLLHELRVYQVELEMQNRELRDAQAEIELVRDRYTALYDFAPVAYVTLDEQHVVLAANVAGGLLFGRLRDDLIGHSFAALLGRAGATLLHELCTRSETSGGSVTAELPILAQGRVVYVQAVVAARRDGASHTREYLCALIDISERKRVERERDRAYAAERVLHQRFESLDRLNVAISNILATEERASVEAVLETVVENVLTLLDAEHVVVRLLAEHEGGTPKVIARTRSGSPALDSLVSLSVSLRLGSRRLGELTLAYDAHRDVVLDTGRTLELLADRVAVALEIARLNGLERRERQRLALLERAGTSLARCTELEHVQDALAEAAASTIPGFATWSVVYLVEKSGRRVLCTAHANEGCARRLARLARRVVQSGVLAEVERTGVRSLQVRDDARLARHGDSLDFAYLHVLPLIARERVLGVMAFGSSCALTHEDCEPAKALEELSARCAAALDVARLLEELRTAVESRDTLLALVSHDLRSPLNAIALTAHALGAPPGQRERRGSSQQLDLILRSVARMSALVEDLLTAANLDAGHFVVEPVPISPSEILREAHAMTAPMAAAKGLQFVNTAELTDLPAVLGDRSRVLQVLTNLIGNAVKFTPTGGVLRLAAEVAERAVRFAVIDSGPGIAPHDRERLFDRYWTGRRSGRGLGLGLGLGLFIAERIVSAHGGRIWVESAPQRGSSFYFELPLAMLDARDVSPTPSLRRPGVHA